MELCIGGENMTEVETKLRRAAEYVEAQLDGFRPELGLVLGS